MADDSRIGRALEGDGEGAAGRLEGTALLRLLQMVSGQFPIGAFAYSGGLEAAVACGWVADDRSLEQWLAGLGEHGLGSLDLPVLHAAHRAWSAGQVDEAYRLAALLCAQRESAELLAQEQRLGRTFSKALETLEVPRAAQFGAFAKVSYVVAFALGAAHFAVSRSTALLGFGYAWCEQQVTAATRLLPMGHAAAQRVLTGLLARVPAWAERACSVPVEEVGQLCPGLALASAWHETQYSRLFLS
jgi:urease accessory protein